MPDATSQSQGQRPQSMQGQRSHRAVVALARLSAVLVAAWATVVTAQDRCDGAVSPGEARLALHFEQAELEQRLGETTLKALRSTLAKGVSACLSSEVDTQRVTASLLVSLLDQASNLVRIEISDHATNKRLTRELSLSRFPVDSRALALAVALDELLRASWLELALAQAQQQRNEAPQAVQQVMEADVAMAIGPPVMAPAVVTPAPDSEQLATALWAQLSAQVFTGGEFLLGPDLGLSVPVQRTLALTVSLGARRGPFHESALGKVRLTGAAFAVGLRYALWLTPRFTLSADAALSGLVAQAGAIAQAGSRADNDVVPGSSLRLGATLTAALLPALHALASASLGYSVVPIIITDGTRALIDTRGLELHIGLGLELHP